MLSVSVWVEGFFPLVADFSIQADFSSLPIVFKQGILHVQVMVSASQRQ